MKQVDMLKSGFICTHKCDDIRNFIAICITRWRLKQINLSCVFARDINVKILHNVIRKN